jgi:hypothetical protein
MVAVTLTFSLLVVRDAAGAGGEGLELSLNATTGADGCDRN